VVVTHVPDIFGTRLSPADLKTVLAEADGAAGAEPCAFPKAVLHVLTFKACRRAVKFGDVLSHVEMSRLLRDLGKCDFPFQCAHGRPTVYPFLSLCGLHGLKAHGKPADAAPLLQLLEARPTASAEVGAATAAAAAEAATAGGNSSTTCPEPAGPPVTWGSPPGRR